MQDHCHTPVRCSTADLIVDVNSILAAWWHAQITGTAEPAIALHIKGVVGGSWDGGELPNLAAAPIICKGSGSQCKGTQRSMKSYAGPRGRACTKLPAPSGYRGLHKAKGWLQAKQQGCLHASFAVQWTHQSRRRQPRLNYSLPLTGSLHSQPCRVVPTCDGVLYRDAMVGRDRPWKAALSPCHG